MAKWPWPVARDRDLSTIRLPRPGGGGAGTLAPFVHPGAVMDATLVTQFAEPQTPFGRLRAICAHSGLDLGRVDAAILERMRLLAETTETLRDCERSAELAEEVFRYYDVAKPLGERFTALERHTVVIGTLFSDIGKTGPGNADLDGQRLIAEMFGVERVLDGQISVEAFLVEHFPADVAVRVSRFRALGLDPKMSLREFWNLHSVWTLQILRGDGVPPLAVAAAAMHHLLENVHPHPMFAADLRFDKYIENDHPFSRQAKLVIVLDKYDAARRRGCLTHPEAIAWIRRLIAAHPRFHGDQTFVALIDSVEAVGT